MEFSDIGLAYIRGWVVVKAKTKKQDDTNGRVSSGYDITHKGAMLIFHYKA